MVDKNKRNNMEELTEFNKVETIWSNKKDVLDYIERTRNGYSVRFASKALRSSFDVMSLAVQYNGQAIQYALGEMREDERLAILAVKNNVDAFLYMGKKLTSNINVCLAAIKKDYKIYSFFNKKVKNDSDIFYYAVKSDASLFRKNKINKFRDVEKIVRAAIDVNPDLMECASDRLKSCKRFAHIVLSRCGKALRFLSNEIRDDDELVWVALKNNPWSILFASNRLKNQSEFVHYAIAQDYRILSVIKNSNYLSDEQLALKTVKQNGYALMYFSKEIRANKVIVEAAVENEGGALQYASSELRNDLGLAKSAITTRSWAYKFFGKELKSLFKHMNLDDSSVDKMMSILDYHITFKKGKESYLDKRNKEKSE